VLEVFEVKYSSKVHLCVKIFVRFVVLFFTYKRLQNLNFGEKIEWTEILKTCYIKYSSNFHSSVKVFIGRVFRDLLVIDPCYHMGRVTLE